jgi:23S rRNA pseudouridine1911/1915/1917 synthase
MDPTNYPDIIYDDPAFLVINKPPGWIAHAGAGDNEQTIVDWFVKNYPSVMEHTWEDLSRVGIVHRLDKDTSGLMVLAKSPEALLHLQQQFKSRNVEKLYKAFLFDIPKERQGIIETYIGRNPKRRQEQTVLPIPYNDTKRRIAITEYKVLETYTYKAVPLCAIDFYPQTGRMHQLRVHAKYMGHPILGDQTYTIKPAKRLSKELGLTRQMLHAFSLSFEHPLTKERHQFTAVLPEDMEILKEKLQKR